MIELRSPAVFLVLVYGYATLWFTTPFFALSIVASLATIVAYRYPEGERARPLPRTCPRAAAITDARARRNAFRNDNGTRAPAPTWLTIPQRGLYTGVMIVGAVGTGKTSACMYPYAEQLLRWRAGDPDRKIGGLVLEVKGDFCQQVRRCSVAPGANRTTPRFGSAATSATTRCTTTSIRMPVAFAIATLVNNLFGKSKEPFWQQAYTDLLKFVILLRRLVDGYTTFAEVYRYILEDSNRERDQRAEDRRCSRPGDRGSARELRVQVVGIRGRTGSRTARTHGASLRRSGIGPARAPGSVRGAASERGRVDRAETPAGRRGPVVYARVASPRSPPPLLHHRRNRRLPLAVRREPGGSSDVLPAEKCMRFATEAR